jgi:CRP-like cAMP-binding protein
MERTRRKVAALRQTRLFGSLDEAALLWLAARAEEQRLSSGEMLFLSGEAANGMFVVVDGKIRAFQQNSEGREQVMHVDTAGATLGDVPVFDDGPYPASAVAQTDSNVLFISKQAIQQFCQQNPPFVLTALKLMAERVRRHAELVNSLSFHEVGQRLALWLLEEAERAGVQQPGRIALRLRLSNHEIATRIGSVRDVVSRALARLQQLGLVVVRARAVTILDARALRVYAESSPKHVPAGARN